MTKTMTKIIVLVVGFGSGGSHMKQKKNSETSLAIAAPAIRSRPDCGGNGWCVPGLQHKETHDARAA